LVEGKGVEGTIDGIAVKLGSASWLQVAVPEENKYTKVFVAFDNDVLGYFEIKNEYRPGILDAFSLLRRNYGLHVLSGDNDAERLTLQQIVPEADRLRFNCLPEQKTAYVEKLQSKGKTVLMIGDGLNDMNAFEKSHVGMAVIEDEHHFLPASDVIIRAERLADIDAILLFIRKSRNMLFVTFGVSIVYNIIGLWYATQGALTPVVAAVLMPISTVSIVGLSFILSRYYAKRYGIIT
jgi:Cu+-exporting ATPase